MTQEETTDDCSDNSRRPQFGLFRLMVSVTLLCILLAVPGGIILFVWLGGWFVVAALVFVTLLLLQWPLYFLMKRTINRDETRHP